LGLSEHPDAACDTAPTLPHPQEIIKQLRLVAAKIPGAGVQVRQDLGRAPRATQ
jgi:hypothetical protein